MKKTVFIFFSLAMLISCNGLKSIKQVLFNQTPYEGYIESLNKAGLKDSPMAEKWIAAGQRALKDSIVIALPFTESGFFQAAEPQANAYSFFVHEGQRLNIKGESRTVKRSNLFVDLFIRDNNQWKPLAHADSTFALTYEFTKNQYCLLRIQPELLINLYYSITITLDPVLINPVSKASNQSIGSFYNDSRDNGKRKHEGLDIFAAKGTPVIAPANGFIYNVGTNTLGGKVVWMNDLKRGQTYYFAHLDSQLVHTGNKVKQGDTLGLVGNTGNAKYTPSHLHFGIYQNGSKDPIYYVRTSPPIKSASIDTLFKSTAYKVTAKEIHLRTGPNIKNSVTKILSKDTYLKPIAQSADWYRVSLADKQQGYVYKKEVKPADKGKKLILKQNDTLWSGVGTKGYPVAYMNEAGKLERLAKYDDYWYVKTEGNQTGWMKAIKEIN